MHLEMTIQNGDIAILKPKRFASLTFLNHTKYWALISNWFNNMDKGQILKLKIPHHYHNL